MFTSADNYVIQIHRPWRSLSAAWWWPPLGVDTALNQDDRGFN